MLETMDGIRKSVNIFGPVVLQDVMLQSVSRRASGLLCSKMPVCREYNDNFDNRGSKNVNEVASTFGLL